MFIPQPVFWSSAAPLPEAALAGYGWDGADLLIGPQGAQAAGRLPGWGADGCHLICRAHPGGHLIAADGRGFARLFLYRSGRHWAVSNSFPALVQGVADLHWPVTPQPWAIAAWLRPETGFDQLPWSATAVAEVQLLQPWQAVGVRQGRARLVPRPGRALLADLDGVLRLWLSRLLTLLGTPGLGLTIELTGGLDSRTCLALALHLRDSGQVADLAAMRFLSALRGGEDLTVATALAARYDLNLNPAAGRPLHDLPDALRLQMWRDWSLGMFAPPYLLPERVDPGLVTLGGHGGEYLRLLPWSSTRADLLALWREVDGWRGRLAFRRALSQAWDAAQGQYLPGAEPRMQYRWAYRLRQLAGHHAQMALRVMPLAGMDFDAWARTRPAHLLQDGALHFEVMERLAPGLAAQPFEGAGYPLPPDLPVGGPPLTGTAGRVWGFDPAPPPPGGPRLPPAALWSAALQTAEAAGAARLVGAGVMAQARATLTAQGASSRGLPDRLAFRPVHAALLAGLIAGAARKM